MTFVNIYLFWAFVFYIIIWGVSYTEEMVLLGKLIFKFFSLERTLSNWTKNDHILYDRGTEKCHVFSSHYAADWFRCIILSFIELADVLWWWRIQFNCCLVAAKSRGECSVTFPWPTRYFFDYNNLICIIKQVIMINYFLQ